MRNTSFGGDRTHLMQESFFGARTGDVIIDLIPGCILEDDDYRSLPTSGYNYDRHVPLIVSRQHGDNRIVTRRVEMTELSATLCHIMGIAAPWATTERPLQEFE